ncbi:unnamed protein product [Calypogeia fissa]
MDHDLIIEQEKAAREVQGWEVEAGTSKILPLGLQPKPKPNSSRSPRHVEAQAVATPPTDPVGSSEAEEPIGNNEGGPTPSSHSDVNLDLTGVIERFTIEVEGVEEQ